MIAIVDYGSGNIKAIARVYRQLNVDVMIARTPEDLEAASKIVLPGVGAFDQVMQNLVASGMADRLRQRVMDDGTPLLGICVGMQLLARRSDEGRLSGLGWIEADAKRLDGGALGQPVKVPHMGWNDIRPLREHPLLRGLAAEDAFYFLHSYHVSCDRRDDVLAEAAYGAAFDCAVGVRNVHGVQFHPEKSHLSGAKLLKNFAEL